MCQATKVKARYFRESLRDPHLDQVVTCGDGDFQLRLLGEHSFALVSIQKREYSTISTDKPQKHRVAGFHSERWPTSGSAMVRVRVLEQCRPIALSSSKATA